MSQDSAASGTPAPLAPEQARLSLVQEIAEALSSGYGVDRLLQLIVDRVTALLSADRGTLYLVTEDGTQLWSKILQGGELVEIRLGVGEGIAGHVAKSGETLNIPDAYRDDRFQPRVDVKSGYRTKSILCTPMRNSQREIVGVLQLLNKHGGPFDSDDEELLRALATHAAVAVENAKLYDSVIGKNFELLETQALLEQKSRDLNVLYEIERELAVSHDLDELLERLVARAMELVGADAGSIALRQTSATGDGLVFRTTAGPAAERLRGRTIAMGEGVIGWVAAERKATIVNDPATDPRHADSFAGQLGVAPRNLIAAPLVAQDEIVGAIELIDKVVPGEGFDEADAKLLSLIAGQASRAIEIARKRQSEADDNRLATIGKMLAGVLHDLKTPMTIISGYVQLMAQIDSSEERGPYVAQILRQFELMSGMTREVLQFARGESNMLVRKVFLHKFLAEVQTQLQHAFSGRGIELFVVPNYDGVAHFDERAILRLVHNLARNAAEAMEEGGRFGITSSKDGDFLVLTFVDTGPGIPERLRGRLFELFATGKKGGTGLGLAVCKKIVDDHGGEISCESEPGNGAVFRVRLPIASPLVEKSGPHPTPVL